MFAAKAPPIYATILTAPVANTTAGVFEFRNRISTAQPVAKTAEVLCGWIENRTGQTMYVKLGAGPASLVNWDFTVADSARVPLYFQHKRLSFWSPAGATLNAVAGMGGSTSPATYAIVGIPAVQEAAANLE